MNQALPDEDGHRPPGGGFVTPGLGTGGAVGGGFGLAISLPSGIPGKGVKFLVNVQDCY